MRNYLTLLLLILSNYSFTQISTTKQAEKFDELSVKPYDSSVNFLGKNVEKYIGQDLYLIGMPEELREYGYRDFILDYNKSSVDKSNIYKCCDSYNSKYSELAGKYFTVVSVVKHPKAEINELSYGNKYFFELKEKESGDRVYFEYDVDFESSFPFIIVGYFDKLKNNWKNKKFVFAKKTTSSFKELKTGKEVTNKLEYTWECVDLTIEEEFYKLALVFKNPLGEQIIIPHDYFIVGYNFLRYFPQRKVFEYEKRFGKSNWVKIWEGKVLLGFTEEMVKLSWGEPDKINRSSYGDQWVYNDQYLYFENGKLKSFN